jgi:hypothetical protein
LPTSRAAPIIKIGVGLAEKIYVNPMIEKYPAIPEIAKAVPNNIDANIITDSIIKHTD